jgi:hypothetical protein
MIKTFKTNKKMKFNRKQLLLMGSYLIGFAAVILQACTDVKSTERDLLCGSWKSMEGKPDVLIFREGDAYKVTVFSRTRMRRRMKPHTYLLQEDNGNLFIHTGFRVDVSYNEETDVLTFSPNGDYVRIKE